MTAMECNRDEAVRAQDLALKKYQVQDFLGAKKMLLRAQQLFPSLEGLSQMLPVMEVHSVAQIKVGSGETDWYGILQVEPGADDSLIKRQYRKLALLLHPDKNKSLGAEGAFKLIGEAWGVLSDKTKRQLHDMRRGVKLKVPISRVPTPAEQTTAFPPSAHYPPFAPGSTQAPPPVSTFWTSCPRCKMQYQYHRTYENYQLQCHKCQEIFKAREISNPNGGYAWAPYSDTQRQDFNFTAVPGGFHAANGFRTNTFPSRPTAPNATSGGFSAAAAAAAAASKVAAAAAAAAAAVPVSNVAADVAQKTFDQVKRERMQTKRQQFALKKKLETEEKNRQRAARQHQETIDRFVTKKDEESKPDGSKRKLDSKSGRRQKRKKGDSCNGDDEEEEESLKMPKKPVEPDGASFSRRRSARTKTNVTYFTEDAEDADSDFEYEEEDESDSSTKVSSDERKEKNTNVKHTENGGKADNKQSSQEEKRTVGTNGYEPARLGIKIEERQTCTNVEGGEKAANGASVGPGTGNGKHRSFTSNEHNTRDYESREVLKSKIKSGSSKPEPDAVENTIPEKDTGVRAGVAADASPCKPSSPLSVRTRSRTYEANVQTASPSRPAKRTDGEEKYTTLSSSSEEEADDDDCITVPDPDFHDFDSTRSETDIIAGQIWAIYDDVDGMPRFYGRVSRVSLSPFKVHLCWLEPTPVTESNNKWVQGSGLCITCGEFKVGKAFVTEQINIFSHLVLDKVGKGPVKIHPRVGDVWAIYKDWDRSVSEKPVRVPKPKGGQSYSYEMVEVLNDYAEDTVCRVARLNKVKGFKTLFERMVGSSGVISFNSSDLPKFSHRVIAQRMEADPALKVPQGSLELDPAATPLDLIMGSSKR